MHPTRRGLAALALLGPLALTGCPPRSCNLMYAPDGVSIAFDAATWPAGAYRVEVDGEACSFTLPSADLAVDCGEGGGAAELSLALSADGQGLEGGSLMGSAPDPLEIRIQVDEAAWFRTELSPAYAVDEPNGEGCGERRWADVTVAVD